MSRKRWVQVDGELLEVEDDYLQVRDVPVVGDLHYLNLPPPMPGENISTRTKHREYMKRHGLTTIDDFPQSYWDKKAQERAENRDPSRKWDIARAIEQTTRRK